MNKKSERKYHLNKKSELIAAILSILLCGLGNIYAGRTGKGLIFLLVAILFSWTLIIPFILWIVSIFTAIEDVKEYNKLLQKELA